VSLLKTKLVPIGNSRGVRLPKLMIRDAGLGDEVELQVSEGAIIISSARNPREGWADAAKLLHENRADRLLENSTETKFDRDEWKW
jgi:antitoxin MazE